MATRAFFLRERFHLLVVHRLTERFTGRAWAVKGGICLRLFHASPRLSEDLDCDVASGIRTDTLRKGVETVLADDRLIAELAEAGIAGLKATAAKQTATTQRWKVALRIAGGGELFTKIEFSRRAAAVPAVQGVPGAALLGEHGRAPFAAPHYDAAAMAGQKIRALAAPGRHAPRDLFDLDLLLGRAGVSAAGVRMAAGETAAAACVKAAEFSWEDFRGEVLPYLTDEVMAAYREPAAFRALRDRVVAALGGG